MDREFPSFCPSLKGHDPQTPGPVPPGSATGVESAQCLFQVSVGRGFPPESVNPHRKSKEAINSS